MSNPTHGRSTMNKGYLGHRHLEREIVANIGWCHLLVSKDGITGLYGMWRVAPQLGLCSDAG
jgi:hypothetical protein